MNKRDQRIRKFNPGTFQSDEEVIEQFVVRKRELDIVLEVLRGNIESPSCQHVLVVAPRGRGKTMLLARVAAEVNTDDKLSESLLPVRFMEESHEIFNLADFWLDTLLYLARESARHDLVLAEELRQTHDDMANRWHEEALADCARAAVLEAVDRLGKKLVLMVENLQALCETVDKDFGWKLRGSLQSEPQIMLLATATSHFKGLEDAEQPFFELFRIVALEPLSTEECGRLWEAVSGDTVSEREIRPVEILTGGSPRLLVIVAGFGLHRSLRQLMEELVELIDEHTEYFRGHLEVLARGERRVYISVIDLWQPSSTGEIAARARMDVRAVSSLLGRLATRGVVIVEGSGKKRLYSAAERLYSIYYKLRRERDEAAVVANLIHFMTVFYSYTELAEMSGKLIAEARRLPAIREGIERAIAEQPRFGNLIPSAWQSIDGTSSPDAEIDDESVKQLFEEITTAFDEGALEKVIEIVDQAFTARSANWTRMPDSSIGLAFLKKATAHEQRGEFGAAIAAYEEVITRFGTSDESPLQVRVAWALTKKGDVQKQRGEFEAAIAAYEEVVARFGTSDESSLQVRVAWALTKKGDVQKQRGEFEAAIAAYEEVVARFGTSDESSLQVRVAWALTKKGDVQKQRGEFEAAIAAYGEVIARFGTSDESRLQVRVAWALSKKGDVQKQRGEFEAAIAAYEEVITRFSTIDEVDLQVPVSWSLSDLGDVERQRGEFEAAIAAYGEVIARFGTSDESRLQVRVAWALSKKGDVHFQGGDFEAAIAAYEEVTARFGTIDEVDLQVPIAWSLSDKGDVHFQGGDFEAAIAAYEEVITRFGTIDESDLQVPVAWAFSKKGDVHFQGGDFEAAIATYEEVITRFGTIDEVDLQVPVAWSLSDKGDVERQRGEFEAAIAAYEEVIARFGTSDESRLQVRVAWALSKKGDVHFQGGDFEAAIAAYEEVTARFGTIDESDLQEQVAWTLLKKSMRQIEMGGAEEALETCGVLELRIGTLTANEKNGFTWRAMCMRALALLVQEKHQASMDMFRSAYTLFEPSQETMMYEMQRIVTNLVANGASSRDLADILLSDRAKSRTLEPLVLALGQHAGESVRAPAEVLEVAADILERIEKAAEKGT